MFSDGLVGNMGPATEHCCHCLGGLRTVSRIHSFVLNQVVISKIHIYFSALHISNHLQCEDHRSKCSKYFNVLGINYQDGVMSQLCKEAESCSCDSEFDAKIVTNVESGDETFGLHNECKCDFWSRFCDNTEVEEACDYASEYCCGDYKDYNPNQDYPYAHYGRYLNSPTCYCDFSDHAQNTFGHQLESKALNLHEELPNPCGLLESFVAEIPAEFLNFKDNEETGLVAIYEETNGKNWTNNDGWMEESVNHCQWHGIACDVDGFVTSIDLRDNNLSGQFPVYSRKDIDGLPFLESNWILSKYGVANLYYLKSLNLADNKLIGTIEYAPLYNLFSLTRFDVSGNQLSGEVDPLVTPSLKHADFSNNRFTSMRRFQKYKVSPLETLIFCDVSNNFIQNDATDLLENMPPNIEQFIASNNQINGNLPASLNNLPQLRRLNLSSNALSGSLPGFTESFATLQVLDLSKQKKGFTGPISENIWRSQSLQKLNLANNRLTGSIPSLIGNLAVLEVFDLTNNNLKGSIPSELGMLEGE